MGKVIFLLIFGIAVYLTPNSISYDDVVDTKWCQVEQDSIIIYLKYDNSYWEFLETPTKSDSTCLGSWFIKEDRLLFKRGSILENYQVLFMDKSSMLIKDEKDNKTKKYLKK